jgi:hypothetical protein
MYIVVILCSGLRTTYDLDKNNSPTPTEHIYNKLIFSSDTTPINAGAIVHSLQVVIKVAKFEHRR